MCAIIVTFVFTSQVTRYGNVHRCLHVRWLGVVQAERKIRPAGSLPGFGTTSSSSSSSLDSSIPPVASASHIRTVEHAMEDAHRQPAAISPPSEQHAAQHVATSEAQVLHREGQQSLASSTRSPSGMKQGSLSHSFKNPAAQPLSPPANIPSPSAATERNGTHALPTRRTPHSPGNSGSLPAGSAMSRDRSISFRAQHAAHVVPSTPEDTPLQHKQEGQRGYQGRVYQQGGNEQEEHPGDLQRAPSPPRDGSASGRSGASGPLKGLAESSSSFSSGTEPTLLQFECY